MYLYLYHVFGTVLILELESRCDNRGIQFPFTLRCSSLIWYRTPGERTLFCIMHTCIHTRFLFLFVFSFIWWGLHSIARFSCNHVISQICANIQLFWVSWISDIIWLETSCLVEFQENILGSNCQGQKIQNLPERKTKFCYEVILLSGKILFIRVHLECLVPYAWNPPVFSQTDGWETGKAEI